MAKYVGFKFHLSSQKNVKFRVHQVTRPSRKNLLPIPWNPPEQKYEHLQVLLWSKQMMKIIVQNVKYMRFVSYKWIVCSIYAKLDSNDGE